MTNTIKDDTVCLKANLEEVLTFVKTVNKRESHALFLKTQFLLEKLIGEIANASLNDVDPTFTVEMPAAEKSVKFADLFKDHSTQVEEFKQVVIRKQKNKRPMVHSIELKPGMVLSKLEDHADDLNRFTNKDDVKNLNFYFKDVNYFDHQGGLYIFSKGDDDYYICENNTLYKIDKYGNLIPGIFNGMRQAWKIFE